MAGLEQACGLAQRGWGWLSGSGHGIEPVRRGFPGSSHVPAAPPARVLQTDCARLRVRHGPSPRPRQGLRAAFPPPREGTGFRCRGGFQAWCPLASVCVLPTGGVAGALVPPVSPRDLGANGTHCQSRCADHALLPRELAGWEREEAGWTWPHPSGLLSLQSLPSLPPLIL